MAQLFLEQSIANQYHLLWFRPISPLHYTLPKQIAQFTWASQVHIPIDELIKSELKDTHQTCLLQAPVWFLTSPTAAYCLAKALAESQPILLNDGLPHLAAVGKSTLTAWHQAGGFQSDTVHLSSTGDSMGLLNALKNYSKVCVVRAQSGREDLSIALQQVGVTVSNVVTYHKHENLDFAAQLTQQLQQLQTQGVQCALLFTSTDQVQRAMQVAKELIDVVNTLVLVTYPRIAQAAHAAGFLKVYLI